MTEKRFTKGEEILKKETMYTLLIRGVYKPN